MRVSVYQSDKKKKKIIILLNSGYSVGRGKKLKKNISLNTCKGKCLQRNIIYFLFSCCYVRWWTRTNFFPLKKIEDGNWSLFLKKRHLCKAVGREIQKFMNPRKLISSPFPFRNKRKLLINKRFFFILFYCMNGFSHKHISEYISNEKQIAINATTWNLFLAEIQIVFLFSFCPSKMCANHIKCPLLQI